MKKIILLVALMFLFSTPAFADKSLFYADNPSSVATAYGATLDAGTQLITGQCNLQSITVSGATMLAGSYVNLYDGTDATGTHKFDITVGTAYNTITIPLHDAEFGTGVFANSSNNNVFISVEYTQ